MVRLLGIAPRSADYQSAALLLSYGRTERGSAEMAQPRTKVRGAPSGCPPRAARRTKVAESGGLAPQPVWPVHLFSRQRPRLGGFTLQIGPRGRICTCVGPLRRRRPELLGHAELDLAAGLSPATPRSKRGMIYLSPHEAKLVPLPGLAPGPRPSQSRMIAFSPQGGNGARRRNRTGLIRFTGPARRCLRLVGKWSPRRATLPGLALI